MARHHNRTPPLNITRQLYQTHVTEKDEYGASFWYTKGQLTPSRQVAERRLTSKGLKGYVQEINSCEVVFQNMLSNIQSIGL